MTDIQNNLHQRIEEKKLVVENKRRLLDSSIDRFTDRLKPASILKSAANNIFKTPFASNSTLKNGLGLGIGVIADRLLFKKSGIIIKTAGLLVMKKLVDAIVKSTEKRKMPAP